MASKQTMVRISDVPVVDRSTSLPISQRNNKEPQLSVPLAPNKTGAPTAHQPLTKGIEPSGARVVPWRGRVLTRHNLHENRVEHGAKSEIRAYAAKDNEVVQIDRTKPPVLIVHGLFGNLDRLVTLAESFRKKGRQVFFFLYDSTNRTPRQNGADFARHLCALQQFYGSATRLDLVAHSLGGIVAHTGLNDLQDPRWLDDASSNTKTLPRGGFGTIRFVPIDSPWAGLQSLPIYAKRLETAKRLLYSDPLIKKVASVELRGVEIISLASTREDRHVKSLLEMDDATLQLVVDCIRKRRDPEALGSSKSAVTARNLFYALRQDARYPLLKDHLDKRLALREALPLAEALRTLDIPLAIFDPLDPQQAASVARAIVGKLDRAKLDTASCKALDQARRHPQFAQLRKSITRALRGGEAARLRQAAIELWFFGAGNHNSILKRKETLDLLVNRYLTTPQ